MKRLWILTAACAISALACLGGAHVVEASVEKEMAAIKALHAEVWQHAQTDGKVPDDFVGDDPRRHIRKKEVRMVVAQMEVHAKKARLARLHGPLQTAALVLGLAWVGLAALLCWRTFARREVAIE